MMNMERIGKTISEQRKKRGYTQEQLAEAVGVTAQAVSKWENGRNLPDIDNLITLSELLGIPYSFLTQETEEAQQLRFRNRLFHEDNMFTRVKTLAQTERLDNTSAALNVMREKHRGQYRKGNRHAVEQVAYINHPLMMACHAHAMGLRDDALLAAILLHDVVEDTDTALEELPVSDEVREIVGLVTKQKGQSKEDYYRAIRENKKACMVKVIDRCNNVSTMAGCFSRKRMAEYIAETEDYVFPLLTVLKNQYPEYHDAAFLIKYQLISLMESIKSLLV